MKEIKPYFMGSGRSSMALKKSLAMLALQHPEWTIRAPVQLKRAEKFPEKPELKNAVLFITSPHGLHAQSILAGVKAGFQAVVCEKPVCVSRTEVKQLRAVKIPVAVCHGYRQMWGLQTIRQMLKAGELGEVITIEGRYWQSSTAQNALKKTKSNSWKNDVKLSGPSDVLLDIGTHWVDAACFLMNDRKFGGSVWKSFSNAEAAHRDTHVHLNLSFKDHVQALGSISKTVHGATNHFEVNVMGTKKSVTWKFLSPDELVIGEGADTKILSRKESTLGSEQAPFHALGWLEGYVEITKQLLLDLNGKPSTYPNLQESLEMMDSLFKLKS